MADRQPNIMRTEVEVLSTAINAWVIRTPGRAFPALVIQGDSFSILLSEAEKLLSRLRTVASVDSEVIESAQELHDALEERLQHYEAVLHEHGIELPYNR